MAKRRAEVSGREKRVVRITEGRKGQGGRELEEDGWAKVVYVANPAEVH